MSQTVFSSQDQSESLINKMFHHHERKRSADLIINNSEIKMSHRSFIRSHLDEGLLRSADQI